MRCGKYYIYAHVIEETGELFYIGKGTAERAAKVDRPGTHHSRQLRRRSLAVKLLADMKSDSHAALAYERELIQKWTPPGNYNIGGPAWSDVAADLDLVEEPFSELEVYCNAM